jgi:hypothetical protein
MQCIWSNIDMFQNIPILGGRMNIERGQFGFQFVSGFDECLCGGFELIAGRFDVLNIGIV